MSNFWKELFRLHGTTLKQSTAYHPQTDGQSEIVNKLAETYLRCFASGQPRRWANWLPWAKYWYNTSIHYCTRMSLSSPCMVVTHHHLLPPPITCWIGQTAVGSLEAHLQEIDAILDDLRVQLLRAQQKMKDVADQKRRELQFDIGSLCI